MEDLYSCRYELAEWYHVKEVGITMFFNCLIKVLILKVGTYVLVENK